MTSGIIAVNKPAGFTSFDVVAKLRGILKIKKIGHAGTLDPMATGVLPVFAGKAAKACDIIPDSDKRYTAQFKLGMTTDTLDVTGKTIASAGADVSREQIEALLGDFRGNISQLPPMFSAVSVNGKRLYELAREGKTVERKPRNVTVNSIELVSFDEKSQTGVIDVDCSKGTYIRSIINDIGEKLPAPENSGEKFCGAVMTGLVRTRACGFEISDCLTLEQLQDIRDSGGNFDDIIIPVENVFSGYPQIRLNEFQTKLFINGVRLDINRLRIPQRSEIYRVFACDGEFLGLAAEHEDELKAVKMFFERR